MLGRAACGQDTPVLGLDLSGHRVDPFAAGRHKAVVLLFIRTDCPISNRYAPEIRRIYEKFAPQGVSLWLVYIDPQQPAAEIQKHLKDYSYPLPALRDPEHKLVKLSGVEVTPEAAVFVPQGSSDPSRPHRHQMVYRGRIDDWYVDFGKSRPAPTTHDLEQALEAILAHKPVKVRTTWAVGCFIGDSR